MDENEQSQGLQYLKDQLAEETFLTDCSDYSHEKVEALVKLISLEEGGDEEEIEESYADFLNRFEQISAKGRQKKSRKRKGFQVAAAMLAVFLAVNISSQAFAGTNIFAFLDRKDHLAVEPAFVSEEAENFSESNAMIFDNIPAFAEYFADDFMFCSWLPEGYQLSGIKLNEKSNIPNYLWEYETTGNKYNFSIQICQKSEKDIAGVIGNDLTEKEPVSLSNGISAAVYSNNDICIAVFEYNNWWYLLTSPDEDSIKPILGGMKSYEEN